MNTAQMSMMLDRGLTAAEKVKFERIGDRFAAVFGAAGHVVRTCEATYEGTRRLISFVPGLFGPPLLSIPADRFLAMDDDELVAGLATARG